MRGKGGGIIEITFAVLLIPSVVALFFLPERLYWPFLTYGMLGISMLLGVTVGVYGSIEGQRGTAILGKTVKGFLATGLFVIPMTYVGFVAALMVVAWLFDRHFDTSSRAIGAVIPKWLGIWIGAHVLASIVAAVTGMVLAARKKV